MIEGDTGNLELSFKSAAQRNRAKHAGFVNIKMPDENNRCACGALCMDMGSKATHEYFCDVRSEALKNRHQYTGSFTKLVMVKGNGKH